MQPPGQSEGHGLADPGLAAARARVADVLEQFGRVEFHVVVVAPPDEARNDARARGRTAAIVAGRGALLEEAVEAARDLTIRTFARGGFSGTWAATDMAVSVVRGSDRVAAAQALEGAVIAAVVEDLVDEETLEVLRSTADELVSLRGIPPPGSLSAVASPAAGIVRGTLQVAIVAAVVIVCALVGFGVGSMGGLVVVLVGVGIIAALARRSSIPIP